METPGNGLLILIKILGHFSFGGNFADDEECFALSTSCSVNVTVLGDLSCFKT